MGWPREGWPRGSAPRVPACRFSAATSLRVLSLDPRCGGCGDTKALRCLSASSVARRQIGLAGAGQDGLAVTVPKNDIASTSVRSQVLSATCTGGTVSNRANIFLRLRRPGCRGNAVQCKRRAWTSGDRLATSYSKAGATADPPREVYVHSDISQPAIQSISPQA